MANFEVDLLDEEVLSGTAEAIRLAIKDAGGLDGLASSELEQMLQSVEQMQGVLNHALYHLGRPGECGEDCPAL